MSYSYPAILADSHLSHLENHKIVFDIQSFISSSAHATEWLPSGIGFGNLPSLIQR